jgi:hypothetical protein
MTACAQARRASPTISIKPQPRTRWPDNLPSIACHPMRAIITPRQCHLNQRDALNVKRRLHRTGSLLSPDMRHAVSEMDMARFVSCAGCNRCVWVGEEDLGSARAAMRRDIERFESVPLDHWDNECQRARRTERNRRKWEKRKQQRQYQQREEKTTP